MNASFYSGNLSDEQIDRLARKRAGMRLGWLIHATVYVLVNLMLIALSVAGGRNWHLFPLLGWGLGLAIHGAVVLFASPGSGLMHYLVNQERARLAARRDAW